MKTTSTTTIVTQTPGTVKVTYSEAELIRCVAKQDLPAYGIKAGETFYLSRSSKNDGTYYVTHFDSESARWFCSCPSVKPCRHQKSVNAVLAIRRAATRVIEQQRNAAAIETRNAMSRYQYGYHD